MNGDPSPQEHKSETPPKRGTEPKTTSPFGRWWILLLLLLPLFWLTLMDRRGGRQIPYSEFKKHLANGEVKECSVGPERVFGEIEPRAAAGEQATPFRFEAIRVEDPDLTKELAKAGIEYTGVPAPSMGWLQWFLPLGLLLLFWIWFFRRMNPMGGAGGAALSFGKSKAKLIADMDTGVNFDDVAGCDEAKQELEEVVDFLRNPARYVKLGAKIPKGLLLVGPPGTGKTLLSKAIAGEAHVPFFSISGSDFVEMFVGVGAARVRDLFEQAKKKAPCIVFIDEIDAIGRTRGVHMSAVNDEREQTLNQLLVELDGFEPNSGVILLAATNRPDVLDRALLRPGRFDRQVVLDTPDLEGRKAILEVHARGKPIDANVDFETIAKSTPGFSGADLANALNEAALLAARRSGDTVTHADVEAAIERLVAGPERKTHRLSEEEKRRVAYHESGHALVARFSEHADPVHKISIVPRGRAALGWTMQLPQEEQFLLTRKELDDKIAGLLGGRAAEDIVFGHVSTGAANDLERATTIVRQMVCVWGMGESTGLMHCAHEQGGFALPWMREGALQRDCSEATAREIDEEVKGYLDGAYERATEILRRNRPLLDRVAEELLAKETLSGEAFEELVGKTGGEAVDAAAKRSDATIAKTAEA